MARIATGSIVADIAGKVGDEIFSRNRQGPYVKAYTVPVQPNTSEQILVRGYMAAANTQWTNLTNSQYTEYVAFAKQFSRSAFNASRKEVDPHSFFIGNSLNRNRIMETSRPKPKMPINIGFSSFELDFSDGIHMYGTWRGGVNNSDYIMSIYSTLPKPLGVHSINSVQQVYFHQFTYQADIQKDLFPNWFARFGVTFPTTLQRTFISTKIIHEFSGIQVGFGWDSVIGASVVGPYDIGNTDIRSLNSTLELTTTTEVLTTLAGLVTGLTIHVNTNGGFIKVGIYDDNSGLPDNLLASSGSLAVTAVANWQTFPFSAPIALTSGSVYHIAVVGDGTPTFNFENAAITRNFSVGSGFNLPDPFGAASSSPAGISNYITVTP